MILIFITTKHAMKMIMINDKYNIFGSDGY